MWNCFLFSVIPNKAPRHSIIHKNGASFMLNIFSNSFTDMNYKIIFRKEQTTSYGKRRQISDTSRIKKKTFPILVVKLVVPAASLSHRFITTCFSSTNFSSIIAKFDEHLPNFENLQFVQKESFLLFFSACLSSLIYKALKGVPINCLRRSPFFPSFFGNKTYLLFETVVSCQTTVT